MMEDDMSLLTKVQYLSIVCRMTQNCGQSSPQQTVQPSCQPGSCRLHKCDPTNQSLRTPPSTASCPDWQTTVLPLLLLHVPTAGHHSEL